MESPKKKAARLALTIGVVQMMITYVFVGTTTPGRVCVMALLGGTIVIYIRTVLHVVKGVNAGTAIAFALLSATALIHIPKASDLEFLVLFLITGTGMLFFSFISALNLESLLRSKKDHVGILYSILLAPQVLVMLLLIPSVVFFSV